MAQIPNSVHRKKPRIPSDARFKSLSRLSLIAPWGQVAYGQGNRLFEPCPRCESSRPPTVSRRPAIMGAVNGSPRISTQGQKIPQQWICARAIGARSSPAGHRNRGQTRHDSNKPREEPRVQRTPITAKSREQSREQRGCRHDDPHRRCREQNNQIALHRNGSSQLRRRQKAWRNGNAGAGERRLALLATPAHISRPIH